MPSPTFTPGTVGNVINAVSVPKGATIAAFLPCSTDISAYVDCQVITGGTAPTAGTAFSAYRAIDCAATTPFAPMTLSAAVTAGTASTSLSVADVVSGAHGGLHPTQMIALVKAGAAPQNGEIVAVGTAGVSGSGPFTVPVTGGGANGGTLNSYASGDYVFLIGQRAVASATPSGPAATWAANSYYSAPLELGSGQYVLAASNADAAQAVTASATADLVPSYA